jgi:hypothetical protein
LFYNFCHKNLHIFALPSSAVLKPAQAGLVHFVLHKIDQQLFKKFPINYCLIKFSKQKWLTKDIFKQL